MFLMVMVFNTTFNNILVKSWLNVFEGRVRSDHLYVTFIGIMINLNQEIIYKMKTGEKYKIYHYVWSYEMMNYKSNCFHVGNRRNVLIEWMVYKSNDQSMISDSLYTAVWGEIYVHDGTGTEKYW